MAKSRANQLRQPPRDPRPYRYGHYGITLNNSNPDMRSQKHPGWSTTHRRYALRRHLRHRFPATPSPATACSASTPPAATENAARFGCYYGPADPEILEAGHLFWPAAPSTLPARHNLIQDNRISGFKMQSRCILGRPRRRHTFQHRFSNVCRDR